jgi:hypothetical protein
MTKLPLVFYEKDLYICLSFVWETSRASCLFSWLAKVAFFVGQNSNLRIVFILGRREYNCLSFVHKEIYLSRNSIERTVSLIEGGCLPFYTTNGWLCVRTFLKILSRKEEMKVCVEERKKNGKFSVKSIYDLLTSTDCGDSFTRIWKAKVPYKNKIFLWLRTMPSLQKITWLSGNGWETLCANSVRSMNL